MLSEYKACYERWLAPFVLDKPDCGHRVIRKVVTYWGMEFIQYTPAPDGYTPAPDETIIHFKAPPKGDGSEPTISELCIPPKPRRNNFPTKF